MRISYWSSDVCSSDLAIKAEFGDARRTEIQHSQEDLNVLDLIAPEDMVVTLSHTGYVKRQPASTYRSQKRGGKGRSEERRVGKECVRMGRSRWSPYH